jgi:hypothetical protein
MSIAWKRRVAARNVWVVTLAALVVIGLAVAGIVVFAGGGGKGSAVPAWETQPMRQSLPVLRNGDPDSNPGNAGEDIIARVKALGNGHFELRVENDSALGYLNTFTWIPPRLGALKVTTVTSTTKGSCSVSSGNIVCHVSLRPPRCTCRPGESMLIRFDGVAAKSATNKKYPKLGTIVHAWEFGGIHIGEMTPVPYIIPDSLGESQSGVDLPTCKPGEKSVASSPCTAG